MLQARENVYGKARNIALTLALGLFLAPLLWAQEKPGKYSIAGSGSNLPITRLLVKAFMDKEPGIKIEVPASIGSTGGINAVHKGKIGLALISRNLQGAEKTWDLKAVPYAKAPLAFVVNPSVVEDNITPGHILSIYAGEKNRWQNGRRIVALIREDGDSGAGVLAENIPGFKEIIERAWHSGIWRIEYSDAGNIKSVERLKDSIGWADLGSIKLESANIKALKFNDIAPTAENVASGRYPLFKEFSFAYTEPLPKPFRSFLEFVRSPEGAAILRRNGYVPVP